MGFRLLIFTLVVALCGGVSPVTAAEGKRLLVMTFARPSTMAEEARAVRDILHMHLDRIGYYAVISADRRDSAVRGARELQGATTCDDAMCAYYVGRKARAEVVLVGRLSRRMEGVGVSYRLIDVSSRMATQTGSVTLAEDLTDLEEKLTEAAKTISGGRTIQIDPDMAPEASYIGEGRNLAPLTVTYDWEDELLPGDNNGHEMVLIPAGEYRLGWEKPQAFEEEQPAHDVYVDGFKIARTETTREQFATFLKDTRYTPKTYPLQQGQEFVVTGSGDLPMTGISFEDARAYCTWLSKRTGDTYRLPTSAEWEVAAGGSEDYLYPWGNDFDPETHTQVANYIAVNESHEFGQPAPLKPVGSYPKGASPAGLLDVAGNVWEWCLDYFDPEYYKQKVYGNPCNCEREAIDERTIRGGAWNSSATYLRTSNRAGLGPESRQDDLGFRVVMELPKTAPSTDEP